MVERLWVPLIHVFVARNWNLAISVSPFTASSVANRVAVSTPLRIGFSVVVTDSLVVFGRYLVAVRSRGGTSLAVAGRAAHPWSPPICPTVPVTDSRPCRSRPTALDRAPRFL